jgi:hypothetical protein
MVQRRLVGDGNALRRAVRTPQIIAVDRQATLDEPLRYGGHVVLGPGRAPQRDREAIGRHAVEIELRAVDEGDADRPLAGADGFPHATDTRERRSHARGFAATCRNDVDVVHKLAPPPYRTGNFGALDVRVGIHRRSEAARFAKRLGKQDARAGVAKEGDPFQDLVRGLWAKARELGEPAIARCLLELADGLNSECLMDLTDLRDAEPRNAKHLEQAFGRRRAQTLEV